MKSPVLPGLGAGDGGDPFVIGAAGVDVGRADEGAEGAEAPERRPGVFVVTDF